VVYFSASAICHRDGGAKVVCCYYSECRSKSATAAPRASVSSPNGPAAVCPDESEDWSMCRSLEVLAS
jgi:hypothetical protein